jgi:predicted metal-binding protein
MSDKIRVGIIICNRYRRCAGGKCLRALRAREGAFGIHRGKDVELVGYTTCDGCPGGNVEYAGDEMVANGANVIHLATGMVVGYPPCPSIGTFKRFLEERHGVTVVVGTHPIPEKYVRMHEQLGTWEHERWEALLEPTMSDKKTREAYD